MSRVAIVGIGHSRFGRRTDVNIGELAFESIKQAVEDSGVDRKDISNVVVGSMGSWSEESLPAVVPVHELHRRPPWATSHHARPAMTNTSCPARSVPTTSNSAARFRGTPSRG